MKYDINKEGPLTQGFKDSRKMKRKVSQNFDDLQSLLIKLTVKANSEKAWLLYGFPFSLNPGDKPNDALALKNYSLLYLDSRLKTRVSAKESVMVINILQVIFIGHVLEAPGLYQQPLL